MYHVVVKWFYLQRYRFWIFLVDFLCTAEGGAFTYAIKSRILLTIERYKESWQLSTGGKTAANFDNSPALPESLPDSVSLQWPRLLREARKRLAGLTLSLYPLLRGLPLKNILCNNFCCCWHLPAFSIGYTALNILHIQGLLYTTAYVFKFYSGKCQVQDCSYLVTYIVCRKNIVFDEKKKKIFFNSLRLHPTDN